MKLTRKQARDTGIKVEAAKRKPKHGVNSELFAAACEAHGLPRPAIEYKFRDDRKWKIDFAWCDPRNVALEIEGGAFRGEGHRSVGVYLRNIEKYNEICIDGFCFLRCTTDDVKTGAVFALLKRAFGMEGKS